MLSSAWEYTKTALSWAANYVPSSEKVSSSALWSGEWFVRYLAVYGSAVTPQPLRTIQGSMPTSHPFLRGRTANQLSLIDNITSLNNFTSIIPFNYNFGDDYTASDIPVINDESFISPTYAYELDEIKSTFDSADDEIFASISAHARKLQTQNCPAGGSGSMLYTFPSNGNYLRCGQIVLSTTAAINGGTPSNVTISVSIQSGKAELQYGLITGQAITAPAVPNSVVNVTLTPTCDIETKTKDPITVFILPSGCTSGRSVTFQGVGAKENITSYIIPSPQSVYVGKTLDLTMPSNAFHNYDGVGLIYSGTWTDNSALTAPFNFFNSNNTLRITPISGDQKAYRVKIKATNTNDASDNAFVTWEITVDNRAPYVANSMAPITAKLGQALTYTLPYDYSNPTDSNNLFLDADNYVGGINDIRNISGIGLRSSMTLDDNKVSGPKLYWTVDQIGTTRVAFRALDAPGIPSSSAELSIEVTSSLEATRPSSSFSVAQQSTVTLPNYAISTLSTNPITVTYKLADASMGLLSCSSAGVTSDYNNATRTLTISGTATAVNSAQVIYAPGTYKGAVSYTSTIKDGLNPDVTYSDMLGTVNEIFIAPTNTTSVTATKTVNIGQTDTVVLPAGLWDNPNGYSITYTAVLASGSPAPSSVTCHPTAGTLTFAPQPGDQTTSDITLFIRATASKTISGTPYSSSVDLGPITASFPNRAPSAKIASSTLSVPKGGSANVTLNMLDIFSDFDGLPADLKNITITGKDGAALPSYVSVTRNSATSYTVSVNSGPSTGIELDITATDLANASAKSTLTIAPTKSLFYDTPASNLQCLQTEPSLLPNFNIRTLSSQNVTVTYQLFNPNMGSLSCTSPGVTGSYDASTGTFVLTGSPSALNSAQVYYNPGTYKGSFRFSSIEISDGGLNTPETITTLGGIVTEKFLAPQNTTTITGTRTVNIGASDTVSLPTTLWINHNNYAITYTGFLAGDRPLPNFIKCDPNTGATSITPVAGDQTINGNLEFYIKATTQTVITTNNVGVSYSSVVNLGPISVSVPNRAPSANTPAPLDVPKGGSANTTLDIARIFSDSDGITDFRNITFTSNGAALPSFIQTTKLSDMQYRVSANPGPRISTPVEVTVTDSAGETATATLTIRPTTSLFVSAPSAISGLQQSAILLPNYNIRTEATGDVTVTYQLFKTEMGSLSCNSAGVVSTYNTATGTLTLTGRPTALNTAQIYYHPGDYKGDFLYSSTVNDGLNDIIDAELRNIPGTVNEVFIAPTKGTSISSSRTVNVGATDVYSLPSGAVVNPNSYAYTYSAQLANGSPVPACVTCNPSSGRLTIAPQPGDQTLTGDLSVIIRASTNATVNGTAYSSYVDLDPVTVTIPVRLPQVQSGFQAARSAPRGTSITIPTTGIFSAPDNDIASITFKDLKSGMSVVNGELVYIPGRDTLTTPEVPVTIEATTLLGQKVSTTITFNIRSSLSPILPPAVTQICEQNSAYCDVTLPTMASPSDNSATIEIQLTDQTKGKLELSPAATGVTLMLENGVPTLRGKLVDISRPGVVRFTPTENTFGTVQVSFNVVDDGIGNSGSLSSPFTISVAKKYIAPVAGNPAAPATGKPTESAGITFPDILNANKDPETYRARIYSPDETTLLADSNVAGNAWNLTINNAFKRANFIIPETMRPGVYIVKLTTGTTAGPVTVEQSTTLTVTGSLTSLEPNNVASINVNTLTGGQATISLFKVNYVGSQMITVKLDMPENAGEFSAITYLGYTPTVTKADTRAKWELTAPKEVMNWFLSNFEVKLKPTASGQILISGTMDTGIEQLPTPGVSLVPVITVELPPPVEPAFEDKPEGKATTWVIGVVGSLLFAIGGAYARGKWATRKENTQLNKIKAITNILGNLHDEFKGCYEPPYEDMVKESILFPETIERFLKEVSQYAKTDRVNSLAFERLEQFRHLTTAFVYSNIKTEYPVVIKDEWQLLDKATKILKNLKSSMQSAKPNYDLIAYRLRLARTLLDMVLCDDTFNKRRILIQQKLDIIELINSLEEAKQILDTEKTADPITKQNRNRIKFEIKAMYAAVTCMLDDDTTWKRMQRKNNAPQARLWYLKIFLAERLSPYVLLAKIKELKAETRTAKQETKTKTGIAHKTIEPLDLIIEHYHEPKDTQWHVVYAAARALHKLYDECKDILSIGLTDTVEHKAAVKIMGKIKEVLKLDAKTATNSFGKKAAQSLAFASANKRRNTHETRMAAVIDDSLIIDTPKSFRHGKVAILSSKISNPVTSAGIKEDTVQFTNPMARSTFGFDELNTRRGSVNSTYSSASDPYGSNSVDGDEHFRSLEGMNVSARFAPDINPIHERFAPAPASTRTSRVDTLREIKTEAAGIGTALTISRNPLSTVQRVTALPKVDIYTPGDE